MAPPVPGLPVAAPAAAPPTAPTSAPTPAPLALSVKGSKPVCCLAQPWHSLVSRACWVATTYAKRAHWRLA
jgi:hypothetical protein